MTLQKLSRLVLFSAMMAVVPQAAAAQQREPDRFPALASQAGPLLPAPQLEASQKDDFNFIGFLVFGAAGAVAGAYVGYHVDKYFGWSEGDDPGLGGFLLGGIIGGTAGMIFGGHLGND